MSKQRILVDGFNLALEKGTGVATYARNLGIELTDLGHPIDLLFGAQSSAGKNALMREVTFFDPRLKAPPLHKTIKMVGEAAFGLKATDVPMSGKVIASTDSRRWPPHDRILNRRHLFGVARNYFQTFGRFVKVDYENRAEVAHWTYPLPLKLNKAANIYTIHDLVPLRLPYTTLDNKRHYYKLVKSIADKADHIVTVSEASKRDIISLLGADESRVTNTYQSVRLPSAILNRPFDEAANEVGALFGLDTKKFFLFFGAIEPKKNVGRIIEAYLASQARYPLVVVGQLAWKNANDLRLLGVTTPTPTKAMNGADFADTSLHAVARANQIIRLDYLPLSMLTSLIRCARGVVFPSLYEGFGLPILEAMQLGTAVITGTEGSNPEVAGDAALLVNPYDVGEIAEAIRKFQFDDDLVAHYERAGIVRARDFTPERYAERLQDLYRRL